MTSAIATTPSERTWLVGLVSTGHFFSHFVMLALPPMFLMMKPDLGVSYTALGGVVAAMAVTTGAGQVPMGFLVDRLGGRLMLLGGLGLMSLMLVLVAATSSYWALFAVFALAGIGNSVFHPADYAIMAARLDERVFGRAVSIHTFAGYLGWAGAAVVMLPLASEFGWRGAVSVVGLAGLVIVVAMLASTHYLDDRSAARQAQAKKRQGGSLRDGFALMASLPMVMMFAFFALTATATAGIMAFSVVANVTLHGVGDMTATRVLTAHLVASAVGVLVGGWLADRTRRHNAVTALAIFAMAAAVLLIAWDAIGALGMTAGMVLGGLFYGISSPSRDVLVRQATPPGSAGVTFGFTSTGLSVGNLCGPLLFGLIMDTGNPSLLFAAAAAIIAASIVAVLLTRPVAASPGGGV